MNDTLDNAQERPSTNKQLPTTDPSTPVNHVSETDIDPALLHAACIPTQTPSGERIPREQFEAQLKRITRRRPLLNACKHFEIRFANRANLEWLRAALVRHCEDPSLVLPSAPGITSSAKSLLACSTAAPQMVAHEETLRQLPLPLACRSAIDDIDDDDTLIDQYDVSGGIGHQIFGALDTGGLEDVGEDEDEELDLEDGDNFKQYQTQVRVSAAQRWEANRRAGGRKTQKSVVKSWNIFLRHALEAGRVRDDIVDEHSLLLFIDFSANRCRRDRRGEYIPNTRVGASQIKKEFFGALRIRKEQDAQDPSLATARPATTVHVYDAVKTRMDEALREAREGLIPADDAPDIVANTFLAQLSDEKLMAIRYGFLDHRELKSTINGHLAWTMMNASGNRGDDIRALRLCEMQPYEFLHPNDDTAVFAVLGLQSDQEHKARSKAMRTTINPTYTCFIAHRDPEMCLIGALAFFLHYLHDVVRIEEKYDVDYTSNKSWRAIRLLHGSSALVQYNETALQNLFVQSYKKAGVESRIKVHLARHMLGYHQEKMGVQADQTSKLGWSRDTYMNTYAPSLPKQAILGAHGYKLHESYNPRWRKIIVPEPFLKLVCPEAEERVKLVEGKDKLVGATNYWKMVILLRPYLFQAAAAIFQARPNSSLFRLPALSKPEVQAWMKDTFPIQLELENALARDPISLERIQNDVLPQALEQIRQQSALQRDSIVMLESQVTEIAAILRRRTSQWTPAKAHCVRNNSNSATPPAAMQVVARQLVFDGIAHRELLSPESLSPPPPLHAMSSAMLSPRAAEDTGMYFAEDESLRGFIVPSPRSNHSPRPRTAVDLVLPPLIAFRAPGDDLIPMAPIFGTESVQWSAVFGKIRQTECLWDAWRPSGSLDEKSLKEIWDCYNIGEAVFDTTNNQTGVKPPLRLVEQHFQAQWRQTSTARKAWQRFREIPEWIDGKIKSQGVTADDAIHQLEGMRLLPGKVVPCSMNALSTMIANQRKEAAACGGSQVPLAPATSLTTNGRKRRAPTVGGRPKPKRHQVL
ncbi:hypothetical protein BYT27DRAFT_7117820 [Phlegmacium glaucopus]|nr:hypothetical protein BYT27DRAFT_7117820 [Phlegmacium glaucopus]